MAAPLPELPPTPGPDDPAAMANLYTGVPEPMGAGAAPMPESPAVSPESAALLDALVEQRLFEIAGDAEGMLAPPGAGPGAVPPIGGAPDVAAGGGFAPSGPLPGEVV